MSIQAGLRAALLAEETVTAITTNVYVTAIPQDKGLPAVVLIKTNEDPMNHLGSVGDMKTADFEIECRATTEKGAIELGDAIIAAFADFTGTMGDHTCLAAYYLDSDDDHEDLGDGSRGQFITTLDFQFQYR